MADRGGATVTGLKELEQAIDQFPKVVTERLRAVAWQTSRNIMERAKALVPVDTGYTRDNIHIVEDAEHHQFQVVPGTDRPRERFSLHTMKRSGRQHTQKVTLNMLPNWIEYGTVKMRARPFMRPAADAETPHYISEMTRVAEDTTAEAFK